MRVIIAGSRSMTAAEEVATAIAHSGFAITEVISGGARGVDTLGEAWAGTHKIPTRRFPAQWERYGKRAGFRRNEAMAHVADALIAVWDGSSPGTCHMIATARQRGLRLFVWQPLQAQDHHRRRREGFGLPARFSLLSVAGPPPAVGVFLPRGPSSHQLTLKETSMNSTLVGQWCRVRNAEVRAYHTGVPLSHRTGVIAEQYENEDRVVLSIRMEGITELACLLLTDVEVLGATDHLTQTGRTDADTVR